MANVPSLPGYRDFVPLARSESSEVYRAYQDGVDRPVAVKVLLLTDPEAVARFHRELEITVQLGRQHPHIVTVIDTGTTSDGRPCIVMEHYDRGSLHDRLRARGPLPWEEVLAAGTVVADALSFAHRHGVLHRDVKPQNILVLPTSYVVADFGIARRIDAARTTSVEWFSFRHAAPQVLDGEPPAVADDIWSVGSTLFTLLDGLPPFAVGNAEEDTALAYMKRVRTGRRRALNRPDVPEGMVAVIDRCLQHERTDRFPDAAALHAALIDLAAETRAWAPPPAGATAPLSRAAGPAPAGVPGPAAATAPAPAIATGPAPAGTAGPASTTGPVGATGPAGATRPVAALAEGATVKGQPAAVSPSALAQVVASQVAAGGYAVGDETIGPRYTEPPPAGSAGPAPAPSGSLRRILVGTAVALLIGGILGVGGTWVAGLARSDAGEAGRERPASPANSPAPADPGPAAATRPPPTAQSRANPAIAPVVTSVKVIDGTSVRLRWRDRSGGKAQFVVVRVPRDGSGPTPVNLEPLPNNRREFIVEGLDPAGYPHCFLVLALTGKENGASEPSCTPSTR
jgi:hypothetical protein